MPKETLERYSGPATITVEGEEPFAVHCHFVVERDLVEAGRDLVRGLISWQGTFSTDSMLASPGDGRIDLDDGRSGKVLVDRVQGRGGSFVGNGDPPA